MCLITKGRQLKILIHWLWLFFSPCCWLTSLFTDSTHVETYPCPQIVQCMPFSPRFVSSHYLFPNKFTYTWCSITGDLTSVTFLSWFSYNLVLGCFCRDGSLILCSVGTMCFIALVTGNDAIEDGICPCSPDIILFSFFCTVWFARYGDAFIWHSDSIRQHIGYANYKYYCIRFINY